MTLRVQSSAGQVVIDLSIDSTLVVDRNGLKIVMSLEDMPIKVCDLRRPEAEELCELLTTALNNT